MGTLRHVQAKDGQPLIIKGLHAQASLHTVLVSGAPSKIVLNDCQGIAIQSETEKGRVAGQGGGKQMPLISASRCFDLEVHNFDLEGLVDASTLLNWQRTVPCGVLTDYASNGVRLVNVTGRCLHYGLVGRCEHFSVEGADLELCSADFVQACRDHFRISDVMGAYSLAVWPYPELHRDGFQCWQWDKAKLYEGVPVLSDGLIENCTFYLPDAADTPLAADFPWISSADGIMGTDGIFQRITIKGCEVYTNNQNGIRFGPMLDCEIAPDNKALSARGVVWR